MNIATILIAVLSLIATSIVLGIGYWWYKRNQPVHNFIGVDFGANSAQPRRIKNLFGPFKFKRSDKTVVNFPVPQGYSVPRMDGKGTMFFGDLNTGQLFKPMRTDDGVVLDFAHGIFLEKALSDGRVQKIVESTKGLNGITLTHIMIALVVIGVLVVGNIIQFAQG
jgi:hypothetical protein